MKRILILIGIACLLYGCSAPVKETESIPQTQTAAPAEKQTVPPAPEETQLPTETAGEGLIREPEAESTTQTEGDVYIPQGQAGYSILENDHSIRNDAGDILVKIQYEQVILDTAVETFRSINEKIAEDYRGFLSDMAHLNETAPRDWEKQMEDMGALQGSFMSKRTADVTCNSGGIFSIRVSWEWYMGGVYNRDYYGMNFDLTTGEPLALSRLSDLSEEAFFQQLKTIVCDQLNENRDALLEAPEDAMADYTLEDISFCIEEGELVLLFPTYTFGPGVMGATVIKTGLYPTL